MERVLALQGLSSFSDSDDAEPVKNSGDSGICSTASTGFAVSTCSLVCGSSDLAW
ncbi:MAG: hypothetical protein ACLGJB_25875 [Blastocatellia bacterium]